MYQRPLESPPGASYRFAIARLASSAATRLCWNLLARRSLASPRSAAATALSPGRRPITMAANACSACPRSASFDHQISDVADLVFGRIFSENTPSLKMHQNQSKNHELALAKPRARSNSTWSRLRASRQTSYETRARQNVLVKLGYFIGALGRTNVCAPMKDARGAPSQLRLVARYADLRSRRARTMKPKTETEPNVEQAVPMFGVSICFICKDALSIYREFTSRGMKASRPFVGNGMLGHVSVGPGR
jgi:CAP12/Pycsar effector protein, TIR domain